MGSGIHEDVLIDDGGAPIWYVEKDTPLARALARLQNSLTGPGQLRDWHSMTPLIDKVGEFPDGSVYRFEWEREWRVPRRLHLGVGRPAFIFAPALDHAQLKADLATAGMAGEPYVIPPILDPVATVRTSASAAGGR